MKKIGFIVQVITLITALPLLSIMELNHGIKTTTVKNTGDYITASAGKKMISFNTALNGKMPSATKAL
ncbi:MAG: hypothetical protein JWP81_4293 [Ferruginibacter sp.]|nr:hypothetical protein [Ferruginibacter sp.]